MEFFQQTQAQIIDLVNHQIVPGASFGFIHGQEHQTQVLGKKSWQPVVEPLLADELYDLASLTKVMGTVPLIIKFINKNKLGLHDKVQKYLPAFSDERVEIFHLLTHTSGIDGFIPNRDLLNGDELIDALLQLPVTDKFDHQVKYTDTGMIFLGLIIEKITGLSVQKAIEREILNRWHLEDTTFDPIEDRCVPTYEVDGQMLSNIPNDPKARQLGEHCGSAGMYSSLDDVMKFARIMLADEYRDLYKNYTKLDPGRSLGWDEKPNGESTVLFHTGYTGHFIALDYQNQNAMVVLSNRVHPVEHNQVFLQRREVILEKFLQETKQQS